MLKLPAVFTDGRVLGGCAHRDSSPSCSRPLPVDESRRSQHSAGRENNFAAAGLRSRASRAPALLGAVSHYRDLHGTILHVVAAAASGMTLYAMTPVGRPQKIGRSKKSACGAPPESSGRSMSPRSQAASASSCCFSLSARVRRFVLSAPDTSALEPVARTRNGDAEALQGQATGHQVPGDARPLRAAGSEPRRELALGQPMPVARAVRVIEVAKERLQLRAVGGGEDDLDRHRGAAVGTRVDVGGRRRAGPNRGESGARAEADDGKAAATTNAKVAAPRSPS